MTINSSSSPHDSTNAYSSPYTRFDFSPKKSLAACFDWYNRRRPHQSLNWQTPDETYFGALANAQPQAA